MSSILTALKKLEKESTEKIEIQPGTRKIDILQTINQPAKNAWRFHKGLVIFSSFIMLTIFGIFIIKLVSAPDKAGRQTQIPQSQPVVAQQIPEESDIPETPVNTTHKPAFNKPVKPVKPDNSKKGTQIPDITISQIPKNKPVKSDIIKKVPTESTVIFPGKKINSTLTMKPVSEITSDGPLAENPEVEEMPNDNLETAPKTTEKKIFFETKYDPRLSLQAIAWDPDPDSRLAVINDRILREGSTIEGISIILIEQEGVVFKDGSEKWMQIFRIK